MHKTLLIFTFSFLVKASQLFPVPFNKQLTESQGVILGEFLGETYKKDKDGRILTEASFKLTKSVGVENKYLVNQNLLKIYFEGGIWQGLEYSNAKSPRFTIGKNYVVLLTRTSFGFTPYMNRLGAYEYKRMRESTYIESLAFPKHKDIGKIPLKTFNLWVKAVYGEDLSKRNSDKYVFKGSQRKDLKRGPASVKREPTSTGSGGLGVFWITLFFGLLGAMRIRHSKKS